MDLDLTDITDFLHSAARSVGAEVTSPWFYLQLGLILAGAGIAFAAGAAVRSRIDLTDRWHGLAGAASAVHARAGRQRLDGGVRGADDGWRAWSW